MTFSEMCNISKGFKTPEEVLEQLEKTRAEKIGHAGSMFMFMDGYALALEWVLGLRYKD